MKIDLWTKVVFTVIAVCLAILAVRSFQVIPAQATGERVWKVNIVEISGQRIFRNDILGK